MPTGKKSKVLIINPQVQAALASGISLEDQNPTVEATAAPTPTAPTPAPTAPAPSTPAPSTPAPSTPAPTAPTPATPAVAAEAAPVVFEPDNGLVAYLKDEMGTLRTTVEATRNELTASQQTVTQLNAQAVTLQASITALSGVATKAITKLGVVLNTTPIALETMDGVSLAAMYNDLETKLNARFPVGGKSSNNQEVQLVADVSEIGSGRAAKTTRIRGNA